MYKVSIQASLSVSRKTPHAACTISVRKGVAEHPTSVVVTSDYYGPRTFHLANRVDSAGRQKEG